MKKRARKKSYELTHYYSLKEKNPGREAIKQTRKAAVDIPGIDEANEKRTRDRALAIEFHRKFTLPFACLP